MVEDLLNQKELEVYDRQMRVWGIEGQQRIKNANVLVIFLNCINCEVVRHLTLGGVKVILYDPSFISENDTECSYLFPPSSIGKNKSIIAKNELEAMNPLTSIKIISKEIESDIDDEIVIKKIIQKISYEIHLDAICINTMNLPLISQISLICKEKNIPLFSSFAYGLSGFTHFYLGSDYNYYIKSKDEGISEYIKEEHHTESQTLHEFIEGFLKSKIPSHLRKRELKTYKNPYIYAFASNFLKHSEDVDPFEVLKEKIEDPQRIQLLNNTEFCNQIRDIDKMKYIEFNPVCSIIGAFTSQQIIQACLKQNSFQDGLFIYESEKQSGYIYKMNEL